MLKQKFCILHTVPKYGMSTQAHIPVALATLHNFNHKYEQLKPDHKDDDPISDGGGGGNSNGNSNEAAHNDGVNEPNENDDDNP